MEIGCATGFVLNYVGGGTGVDLDGLRLVLARTSYKDSTFVRADGAHLPFRDDAFDTVMIPEILEHVEMEKAQVIVNEGSRVGRRLIIRVPNAGKTDYAKGLVENPEHKWLPTSELMRTVVGTRNTEIELSKDGDFILIRKQCE